VSLTEAQREQVAFQITSHKNYDFRTNIPISSFGDILPDFHIDTGVLDPSITSARYHASYLFMNNARLFKNKKVLDMGSGTGLMGVVMALHGAYEVVMTDISELAYNNTLKNIEYYQELLEKKFNVSVFQGDLFEKVEGKFDFIVFNQPFFPGDPGNSPRKHTLACSMMNNGELIQRFLEEALNYLTEQGRIMMPFFLMAGDTNNPAVQGSKYGYNIDTYFEFVSDNGVQQGKLTIHELTL